MLVSRLAVGQTDSTNRCNDAVPEGLANISAALKICPEVSRLSKTQVSVQTFTEEDRGRAQQLELEQAGDSRKVELYVEAASRHIDEANLVLVRLTQKQVDVLKVSALVIGGIGAGVGGGLHLVNNPQVGHAATVLSLSAGVVGAGINLLALNGPKASTVLAQDVQDYIKFSENNPNFPSEPLHRSQLSRSLKEMAEKLDRLNDEIVKKKSK
jgi:hypothetical protein